jgi:hypothetical protein
LFGTLAIVTGCVLVSLFGSNIPDPKHDTVNDLIGAMTRPAFLGYIIAQSLVTLMVGGIGLYVEGYLFDRRKRRSQRGNSVVEREPLLAELSAEPSQEIPIPVVSQPQQFSQSVVERAIDSNFTGPQFIFYEEDDSLVLDRSMVLETRDRDFIITPYKRSRRNSIQRGLDVRNRSNESIGPEGHSRSSEAIDEYNSTRTNELQRTATGLTIRTLKRDKLSGLVGVLYAVTGGICASFTLLLTKSG